MEYQRRRFERSDKSNDQSKPSSRTNSPKHRSPYGLTAVRTNQRAMHTASNNSLPPFYPNTSYHRKLDQLKTKPTELAARNPEASKCVDELKQEVGTEKKELRESVMYTRLKARSRDGFSPPSSQRTAVRNSETFQKENSLYVKNEEKSNHRESLISIPSKINSDSAKQNIKKPISNPQKSEVKSVKECESLTNFPKSRSGRNLGEDPHLVSGVQTVTPPDSQSRLPVSQREIIRRKRRSEIPLRKNRTDLKRNEQDKVSLLVEKPPKETESETSLLLEDEYLNLFSTLQFFTDFAASTQGIIESLNLGRVIADEEKPENSKTPNHVEQEATSLWGAGKMMDSLTTSSFTILTRLESFHRKNVSSKESAAKCTVKSLKRKSSKNIPDTTTSSKGPKLNVKDPRKVTKSEKEVPRKLRKVSKPQVSISNEVIKTQRVPAGRSENFTTEVKKTPEKNRNFEIKENLVQSEWANGEGKLSTGTQCEGENAETVEEPKTPKTPVNSEKSSTASDSEQQIGDPISKINLGPPSRITITMQDITATDATSEQTEEASYLQEDDQQVSEAPFTDVSTKDVSRNEMLATENRGRSSTGSSESELGQEVFVKGLPLALAKDEPPEKPKESAKGVSQKQMKLDLRIPWDTIKYDSDKDIPKPSVVLIDEEHHVNHESDSSGSNRLENDKEKKTVDECVSTKPKIAEESPRNGNLPKIRKSIPSLGGNQQHKLAINLKTGRKKKIRCDVGDRTQKLTTALFDSHKNKLKPDTKLRSGLTKPSNRENVRDVFEDAASMKLRRRNSEPNSFRGFVWKCTDCLISRGKDASVSSMTSSLRHLNTDEIDDFILWEAIPQRMTSCWEMSLYNFKRPWSVLSCSVFKDNRKSSTPGLILENLRNGGTLNTRQSAVIRSDRVTYRKDNPFDVEPSIAQKNIDIRNWLAALNFPTAPSTSTEVVTEGSVFSQPPIGQNLNKATLRRRKVLPNLKVYEEIPKKRIEGREKPEKTPQCGAEGGKGLTKLSRRKSGGFVRREQFLKNQHPIQRPNVTVNLCVYSESVKESILLESDNRKENCCKLTKYKSKETAASPELSISATISSHLGGQTAEKGSPREEQGRTEEGCSVGGFLKEELNRCLSNVNFWKYLFMLTVSIIITHYSFLNSSTSRD